MPTTTRWWPNARRSAPCCRASNRSRAPRRAWRIPGRTRAMARLPTFVAALAVGLLFAASPCAQAQLFKCVQDGKTVYQQEKCPETAKQSRIREPDSAPEKVLEPKA